MSHEKCREGGKMPLTTRVTRVFRSVRASSGAVFLLKFICMLVVVSVLIQYDRRFIRQANNNVQVVDASPVSAAIRAPPIKPGNVPSAEHPENSQCGGKAAASFNPYTIEGVSMQHYEPSFPVYETSCLPLKFSNTKLPKTVLASHPGSGNTWSRHLIQQLTGLYIGSVYNDILISEEQPSRFARWKEVVWNGSCVAIKSHEGTLGFSDPDPLLYDKAIIVIRRPHDSILAEFKRRHWDVASNVSVLGKEIFHDFRNYFGDIIKSWVNFHLKWLTADICMLVVQYEDLKDNLHSELMRIGRFLGIDDNVLQQSHLDCISGNRGGKLRWPKPTIEESPFTANMNTTIRIHSEHVRYIMKKMHGLKWKV